MLKKIHTQNAPAAIGLYSQAIASFTSRLACSCVEVSALLKGALVEIEVIAST
ncbi:MAG: hypothetical protein LBC85_08205 [Fibromonadaceae bacterium]|jgi:enamine deaminase RidA (YjgF/YER057c/UK114 family)|nr:hypothetical protein [Fibromonadaceae bacterium]